MTVLMSCAGHQANVLSLNVSHYIVKAGTVILVRTVCKLMSHDIYHPCVAIEHKVVGFITKPQVDGLLFPSCSHYTSDSIVAKAIALLHIFSQFFSFLDTASVASKFVVGTISTAAHLRDGANVVPTTQNNWHELLFKLL